MTKAKIPTNPKSLSSMLTISTERSAHSYTKSGSRESRRRPMLNIQNFLLTQGKPEDLKTTRGINFYEHPTLPLIGFKYDQIDSPKTDPIVKEARGIVLGKCTWNVIAKPFNRFFNLGEDQENFKDFDWNDFTCYTKEDGSLMIVYFYDGQ